MKYTNVVEINKPIEKVIELFDNADNMFKWMEGLQKFEHLSGTPGQPGARSRLTFQMGKRKMELIETVTVRNLPHEFTGTYEGGGGFNTVRNKFEKISATKTRYISESEFQLSSLMMKIMGFLMPGLFRKQSLKYLNAFKDFAEKA